MREYIVTCRDGRVGCKYGTLTNRFAGFGMRSTLLDKLAQSLECQKCRVSFVGMPDSRVDSQGAEHTDASDAKENFLTKPYFLITSVQASRERAILRAVLRYIRVDQIKPHSTDENFPDNGGYNTISHLDGNSTRSPRRCEGRTDGRVISIEWGIGGLLPSFGGNPLSEIALWIHKPDSDQRTTQVAGFFTMITCQDSQATAVDWNRTVQSEFRREVRNGGIG